jgi:hypothetical protein
MIRSSTDAINIKVINLLNFKFFSRQSIMHPRLLRSNNLSTDQRRTIFQRNNISKPFYLSLFCSLSLSSFLFLVSLFVYRYLYLSLFLLVCLSISSSFLSHSQLWLPNKLNCISFKASLALPCYSSV